MASQIAFADKIVGQQFTSVNVNEIKSVVNYIGLFSKHFITPAQVGVVGTADDFTVLQTWATYVSDNANFVCGFLPPDATYLTSAEIVFTSTPQIEGFGTIKRTTTSVATSIVRFNIASDHDLKLKVDGNILNANPCTGITLEGSQNRRSKVDFYARYCDVGARIQGNVETVTAFVTTFDCRIGMNVRHQDGGDPDQMNITLMCFNNTEGDFLVDGEDKTTGNLTIYTEGCAGKSVQIQNGYWSVGGFIRTCEQEAVYVTGDNTYEVTFNNLRIVGQIEDYPRVVVNAPNCGVNGTIITVKGENGGVWIKKAKIGSDFNFISNDDFTLGVGISDRVPVVRLGDSTTSTKATGITVRGSFKVDGAGGVAIDFNYCGDCAVYASQVTGEVLFGSAFGNNLLSVGPRVKNLTVTNARTQKDNRINFEGTLTTAERAAITAPFKGYRIAALDSGTLLGMSVYDETGTPAWKTAAYV